MAKKKKVDDVLISIVLDRSGSMESVRDATIEGFNAFVKQQAEQKDGGKARMSLVQFDTVYEVNFVAEPIDNVPEMDRSSYIPRGGTALNDAVVRTVRETETWLTEQKSNDRVLFVIITDGEENSSQEYRGAAGLERVAALIKQKEEEGWTFMFLGANIDAFEAAGGLNIPVGNVIQYDSTPTSSAASFTGASLGASYYRSSGARGMSATMTAAADVDEITTAFADNRTKGTLKPKKVDEASSS